MVDFVTFSGAGVMSNLMVSVASSSCSSLIAGTQSFYTQLTSGADIALSCSSDPVVAGTQLNWTSGAVWTVSSAGIADSSSGFVVDVFDPVLGGVIFGTVISSVIILYLLSRSAGTVIEFIRGF